MPLGADCILALSYVRDLVAMQLSDLWLQALDHLRHTNHVADHHRLLVDNAASGHWLDVLQLNWLYPKVGQIKGCGFGSVHSIHLFLLHFDQMSDLHVFLMGW